MKFVRYGAAGAERPGVIDGEGHVRDLSSIVEEISGKTLPVLSDLAPRDIASLPRVDSSVRLGPCISGVGKIVCIGRNYAEHAAESGSEVPPEPMIFMKATSAISGPFDDVVIPRTSVSTDWEVELGVIIGRHAKYVEESAAMDYVAGYCLGNDVSERDFQKRRAGQFTKGKSCDTFGPLGPWFVTRDEIADPQALDMWLTVNGEIRQKESTAAMIFGVRFLVHYLSQFMSLWPGDVILTGTPAGVGMGMTPPTYLKPGDVMELGIAGLGRQKLHVTA